jgi:hypothetical protein
MMVPVQGRATIHGQQEGSGQNLSDSKLNASVLSGIDSEVMSLEANSYNGNSKTNFNQELVNEAHASPFNKAILTPNAHNKGKVDGVVDNNHEIQKLLMALNTPVKRSKRREGSVDEDSSTRAQSLMAKRNLDAPGMSVNKSFLSFPNAKIKSSITSLGIDCSNTRDIDAGIDNMKELEFKRLLEVPVVGQANETLISDEDEYLSDW